MHQLTQVDIGFANAGITFFLTNPNFKNNEGQHRKLDEDIFLHFIVAKSIDWQAIYGNSVLDVCDSGTTHTPGGHVSDDEDIMEHLRVPNCPSNLSPIKDLAVTCHPCSQFNTDFMYMPEFKCLTKKGVESVTTTGLKKWISKCYKKYQV
jgi:hypothetical protein